MLTTMLQSDDMESTELGTTTNHKLIFTRPSLYPEVDKPRKLLYGP
jgi:hypothetical protein